MFRKAAVGLYLRFIGPFLRRHKIPFTHVLVSAERILVRPSSGPGELLFSLPTLETIRHNYPDSEVSLLIPERTMELVSGAALADRIIVYNEPLVPFGSKFRDLKKGLRKLRIDLYLDLSRPEDRDRRLLASLGAARVRIGNSKGGDFPYLNWEVMPSSHQRDEVSRNLSMLSWIDESRWVLAHPDGRFVGVGDRLWLEDFFLSHSSLLHERRVIVDLTVPRARRGWATRNLVDILKGLEHICSPRLFIIPMPGHENKKDLSDLSKHVTRQVIFFNEPLSRIASLMEKSDLILSSKSDLFSLAFVLGIPCILLIPEDEKFYPPQVDWIRIFRLKRGKKVPSGEIVGTAAGLLEKERSAQ